MDQLNLINSVAMLAVFISILLSIFLFTVKTKNKLSNRLFAGFIVFSAIDISGFFIYNYISNYPNVEFFRWTTSFLIMPLFYLYILSVCYADFRLQYKHMLHLFCFVIVNLVLLPNFYMAGPENKTYILTHATQTSEMLFFRVLTESQFVFYIVGTLLLLKKYQKIYQENYTDTSIMTYKWLMQITLISLTAHLIVVFKNLLKYTDQEDTYILSNVMVSLIAVSILCWFVLKALYYPDLFRGIDAKLKPVEKLIAHIPVENLNQGLSAENEQKIEQIKKYMIDYEPYLEPSLTVQELADKMKIPVRDLSILINHHLDQHFFDFVNEYRIQKAMKILKDPSKIKFTVLEILYEVGFNSKSSFNTAFKKYTGHTPTTYRNN